MYQKKVLDILADLRTCLKQSQPASSPVNIEGMETLEDFDREEECLHDAEAYDALVVLVVWE